jgi:hypothetical protein
VRAGVFLEPFQEPLPSRKEFCNSYHAQTPGVAGTTFQAPVCFVGSRSQNALVRGRHGSRLKPGPQPPGGTALGGAAPLKVKPEEAL